MTFTGCAYGPSCVIEASVKDPSKGTISPERSEDINDPEHVADGKQAVFSYTGEATTLIFTVSSPGECYLHNMSVANEKAASAGNGKIDVWDFGAAVLDAEKYNNLLTVDFLNGDYTTERRREAKALHSQPNLRRETWLTTESRTQTD